MQEEIQSAKLTKKGGRIFQRKGPMVVEGSGLGHSGPNSWNKREPASPKSGIVFS